MALLVTTALTEDSDWVNTRVVTRQTEKPKLLRKPSASLLQPKVSCFGQGHLGLGQPATDQSPRAKSQTVLQPLLPSYLSP